ncbi:hypothetical protein HK103_005418 [Boothiomyces macroporosus]|uniref:Aminopeptidase n=1 Tax=Boothiomyces macroporosus TaxID=261099 RepID=A0AAD5Y6M1_9FUNG|nr:hypothetical protein HK103_005418 [Boothiomyces macroporosus]
MRDVKLNHEPTVVRPLEDELFGVRYSSKTSIKPGKYVLSIKYSGEMNDDYLGLFLSEPSNSKRYVASHFEPKSARKAFPCFDEPIFKSIFNIQVRIPSDYSVISNSPVKDIIADKDKKTFIFEPTIMLSSYLVALAVFKDYIPLTITADSNITINLYSTKSNSKNTKFTLEMAKSCLDYFSEIFNLHLPLEKLDFFPIDGFASEGMENMGLITMETTALFIPDSEILSKKQYSALLTSHELVHHWFGNLWDDLWLNEGFAEYMQYVGVDHAEPSWDIMSYFVTMEHELAMYFDASIHTHPISYDSHNSLFDDITYNKGASILRMMAEMTSSYSPKSFYTILGEYLSENIYQTTTTKSLLNSLSLSSGIDLIDLMWDWIYRPGFPIVSVNLSRTEDYLHFRFQQNRYSLWYNLNEQIEKPWKFYLNGVMKLTNTVTNQVEFKNLDFGLFSENALEKSIEIGKDWKFEYYILNKDRAYFYKILYDQQSLVSLAQNMKSSELSAADKAGYVSDVVTLILTNRIKFDGDLTTLLEQLLGNLKWATSPAVWISFITSMRKLERALRGIDYYQKFLKWLMEFMEPTMSTINWSGVGPTEVDSIKVDLIDWSILLGDSGSIAKCKMLFDLPPKVDRTLVSSVIKGAVRYGDQEIFNNTWDYMLTLSDEPKLQVIFGLAATVDIDNQNRLLNHFSYDKYMINEILQQFITFGHVGVVWDYWENVGFGFGARFETMLETCVVQFHTPELLEKAYELKDVNGIARALERNEAELLFRERLK